MGDLRHQARRPPHRPAAVLAAAACPRRAQECSDPPILRHTFASSAVAAGQVSSLSLPSCSTPLAKLSMIRRSRSAVVCALRASWRPFPLGRRLLWLAPGLPERCGPPHASGRRETKFRSRRRSASTAERFHRDWPRAMRATLAASARQAISRAGPA
jgi:hypothetical protein